MNPFGLEYTVHISGVKLINYSVASYLCNHKALSVKDWEVG